MISSSSVCKLLGAIFILVGILGFISNPIVGADGLFLTNIWHDAVHLLTGILAFAFAGNNGSANAFLKIFGSVYLLVALLGFFTISGNETHLLGLIHVNHAANWLHLVLGVVILGSGLVASKD